MDKLELTILMPCLNEVNSLGFCIEKAQSFLKENAIKGEVLVADNGSTDGSVELALRLNARVINITKKGYGSALLGGIKEAKGKYVIMGDSDDSYDFLSLNPYLENLRKGHSLVMGNRFKGGIKKGAMPLLHKYLGNPVLTFIGNLFFNCKCGDYHCGLRGFDKESILKLNLRTSGMEFASEMIIKSALNKYTISEVPTVLHPDKRGRASHLRTWRDGWRHLRFLLVYSPRWLFLYPGIFLLINGLIFWALATNNSNPFGLHLGIHTITFAFSSIFIGFQSINFAFMTKIYAINSNLLPPDKKIEKLFSVFNLEKGLLLGALFFFIGLTLSLLVFIDWMNSGFIYLNAYSSMKFAIPGAMLIALGITVIFNSFFYSILGMKNNENS